MRLLHVIGLIALLLGVPIPAVAQSTPATSSPTAASGDFTGLVDIGDGRQLWLECAGEGSPTVVLEAGFRTRADLWSDDLIQPGRRARWFSPASPPSPASAPTTDGERLR